MEQQNLILNAILTFVTLTLKTNKQTKENTPPPKPPGSVYIKIGLTVDAVGLRGKQMKAEILIGYCKSCAQNLR